jgi:hypothetical protein
MSKEISLKDTGMSFYGSRFTGRALRQQLERLLESEGDVRINFGHLGTTQSFLDEFLGVVVVRMGDAVVDRLVFSECEDDTRALLNLVIGARLDDHLRLSSKTRASAAGFGYSRHT